MAKLPISIIVLTLNEEHYLPGLLENVQSWAQDVFIVDSLSTDRTVDIALEHGATVVQRRFTDFGDQWNWALEKLPIRSDWVMKIDPDERIPPALEREIADLLSGSPPYDAYRFRRRLWFLGKPMRQIQWVTRMWRTGLCRFSNQQVNEHPLVEGVQGELAGILEHYDSPHLDHWIRKQNRYCTMRLLQQHEGRLYAVKPRLFGNHLEQRMFLKQLFVRLPAKHWWVWCYLMFASGAILDGYAGRSWAWLRASLARWDQINAWHARHSGKLPEIPKERVGEFDPRVLASDVQKQATDPDLAQRQAEAEARAQAAAAERQRLSVAEPEQRLHCVHYLAQLSLARGGVVRAVLDLATVLAARGHRVTLLTHDAADVPESWRHNTAGCPRVVVLDRPFFPGGIMHSQALRSMERILSEADVLHLHEAWGISNVTIAACARRLGMPYIVSPHGSLTSWAMEQKRLKKRTFLSLWGRNYHDKAARVLCTAREEAEQTRRVIPQARLEAYPLVCDLTPFETLPGPELAEKTFDKALAGDDFRLLYLSRLHPKKGADVLVEAVRLLRDQGVECKLLLAGPESEPDFVRQLKRTIKQHGLEERVFFLGMVRDQEKLSLYEAADVFALPTHMENFGLVQIEAMACRTPVITTQGVAIWRELADGGALIRERSAEAFAEAIAELHARRQTLHELGEAARAWAFRELTAHRIVPKYEQTYREVCGRGDAGAAAPDPATSAPTK